MAPSLRLMHIHWSIVSLFRQCDDNPVNDPGHYQAMRNQEYGPQTCFDSFSHLFQHWRRGHSCGRPSECHNNLEH